MKANGAPEKIYIPTILAANTVRYKAEGSIEYTRTDAFIEKAAEWLKLYVLNNDTIDIFEMEEQFKNYMKGE